MTKTLATLARAGKAAARALWKPLIAAETAWWATSGSDLFHQVHDVASARQFAVAGTVAAGVGVLTACERYLPGLLGRVSIAVNAGTRALAEDTGPGTTAVDADLPAAEPVLDPAPPVA